MKLKDFFDDVIPNELKGNLGAALGLGTAAYFGYKYSPNIQKAVSGFIGTRGSPGFYGKGGAGKEQENEERRHKSKHITLLEQILEALTGKKAEDSDEGGGGKKPLGRFALAMKRLGLIAGIILGLALAPFVFFGNFVKQLGVETKAIGAWIKKTARWGKGTFFDPIKNAFNRIMKTGTWADDFKKSFDTKWKNFKARFTPSGLI